MITLPPPPRRINRDAQRRLTMFLCVVLCFGAWPGRAQASDPLDDLASLLDPSADAVLLAPHLKQASEQFTQLMQGMDRAQLMLGSRPIDQLLSFVDITTGVDELRGAAAALFMGEQPIKTAQELLDRTVFLVPVRDREAFRQANFEPSPDVPGGLLHSTGHTFFVRDVAAHAVMGTNADLVKAYQPDGATPVWLAAFGDEGHKRLGNGEVLCVGNRRATERLSRLIADTLPAAVGDTYQRWSTALLDAHEPHDGRGRYAVVFDFDPLALVIREMLTMDTHGMEAGAAPTQRGGLLAGMTDRPHFLAGAVDLRRPATRAIVDFIARQVMQAPPPAWVNLIDTAQVLVAQPRGAMSEALKGGLLRDSAIILRSSDPRALRFGYLRWLASLPDARPGMSVSIEENKTLPTGEVVDVVSVDWQPPAHEPLHGPVKAMLLGAFGWRGHVLLRDDAVLITLGRSPASRARPTSQFSSNAMVQAMLAWLPPAPAGLVFVPVSENLALAEQVMNQLPFIEPVDLPEPAGFVPPVALAIDLADRTGGGVDGGALDVLGITTIIPAQVLTLVADGVLEGIRRHEQQQVDGDEPDGGDA